MKAHATHNIRILTHNIRYAANPPSTGEQLWSVRKKLLLNELHYSTLHTQESFICLQEVLHEQLLDILTGLGPEWTYIGVGRDDGREKGEYNPILYRKTIWELSTWRTVWLNEKRDHCKKGWDAGCVRIITVGTFKHRESRKEIVGLCTHLDNAGSVARKQSAKIVLETISSVTKNSSRNPIERIPFFLAGDLNSEVTDRAYQIINSEDSIAQDSKELAKWKYGDEYTFTGFEDDAKDLSLIDFVFLGPRTGGDWGVEGYAVLPNRFDDGMYNSDHRAVVVDGVLKI